MLIRLRKLLLCLLLVSLPLQSMAGPAHLLVCEDAIPVSSSGLHGHDDGDEHPAHGVPVDQGGTSSHDCCQQYFPAVLDSDSPDADPTRTVYVPAGPAGFHSFVPERLKRPPLTFLAA